MQASSLLFSLMIVTISLSCCQASGTVKLLCFKRYNKVVYFFFLLSFRYLLFILANGEKVFFLQACNLFFISQLLIHSLEGFQKVNTTTL